MLTINVPFKKTTKNFHVYEQPKTTADAPIVQVLLPISSNPQPKAAITVTIAA